MRTYNETVMYRRTAITLYQEPDGHWGWIIGDRTLLATFAQRGSALRSAQRHIDNIRK